MTRFPSFIPERVLSAVFTVKPVTAGGLYVIVAFFLAVSVLSYVTSRS